MFSVSINQSKFVFGPMMRLYLLIVFLVIVHGYLSKSTKIPSSSSSSSSSLKATNPSDKEEKKPWEIGRFLKTVSFYNAFKIPIISDLISPVKTDTVQVRTGDVLWSIDENKVEWGALDDVVMGGVSKSDLAIGQAFNGKWTGFVTSANNGGFAGIRSKIFEPKLDASSCRGIILKVKGDGNRYKFIGRDDVEWNGIAWSTSFDTVKNKFIEVKIPFTKLRPTRFARTVSGIPPFNSKFFTGMLLSLSKFEYDGDLNPKFNEGYFQLELESIKLF